MQIISLQNHKGGVGKTTVSYLLGMLLGEQGRKVLLIDTDPQANLTRSVGIDPEKLELSIFDAWTGRANISDVLVNLSTGITIIPANFDLAFLEHSFPHNVLSKEIQLKKKLEPILSQYEVVIVDTPPNFGLTISSVLALATDIIVPINPHPFGLKGFERFFSLFEAARQELNPALNPPRLLLNMADRTNITRLVMEMMDESFPGSRLRTQLRRSVRVAEITISGEKMAPDLRSDLHDLAIEMGLLN